MTHTVETSVGLFRFNTETGYVEQTTFFSGEVVEQFRACAELFHCGKQCSSVYHTGDIEAMLDFIERHYSTKGIAAVMKFFETEAEAREFVVNVEQ